MKKYKCENCKSLHESEEKAIYCCYYLEPKAKKAYAKSKEKIRKALDKRINELMKDSDYMARIDREIQNNVSDTGKTLKKYLKTAYKRAAKESKPLQINLKRKG